jgi:DNA-3-methyladenine glycosylase II
MSRPFVKQLRAAEAHLSASSPVLADLIERVGPCTLAPNPDVYRVLTGSLIAQFISTAAARSIQGRLVAKLGGRVNPTRVLALSDADLKECGISGGKAKSVRAVAAHFQVTRGFGKKLTAADDATARELLLPLLGVGPWTVDMLLIFSLSRLDVWPVGDLGVRAGVRDVFGLAEMPSVKEMETHGEPWKPYRTVAAWYMWRSRDVKTK